MSLYHLHARLFEGVLADPNARYEFQSRETDDLTEVTGAAKELAARGFTVVIYDHGHVDALPGACDYREIAKYWPDGRVEHHVNPRPDRP
ncbi:hypothetical protein [Pseudonocardia acaciae]|uniref:hypothetical protein n=1 Tax=Pseudonocardia acaciae TaxID=551276 RepID=UPI000491DFBC|nr:hypothetical protein [Pseudonocardia acaciae]